MLLFGFFVEAVSFGDPHLPLHRQAGRGEREGKALLWLILILVVELGRAHHIHEGLHCGARRRQHQHCPSIPASASRAAGVTVNRYDTNTAT